MFSSMLGGTRRVVCPEPSSLTAVYPGTVPTAGDYPKPVMESKI